jgi:hypothetical protein
MEGGRKHLIIRSLLAISILLITISIFTDHWYEIDSAGSFQVEKESYWGTSVYNVSYDIEVNYGPLMKESNISVNYGVGSNIIDSININEKEQHDLLSFLINVPIIFSLGLLTAALILMMKKGDYNRPWDKIKIILGFSIFILLIVSIAVPIFIPNAVEKNLMGDLHHPAYAENELVMVRDAGQVSFSYLLVPLVEVIISITLFLVIIADKKAQDSKKDLDFTPRTLPGYDEMRRLKWLVPLCCIFLIGLICVNMMSTNWYTIKHDSGQVKIEDENVDYVEVTFDTGSGPVFYDAYIHYDMYDENGTYVPMKIDRWENPWIWSLGNDDDTLDQKKELKEHPDVWGFIYTFPMILPILIFLIISIIFTFKRGESYAPLISGILVTVSYLIFLVQFVIIEPIYQENEIIYRDFSHEGFTQGILENAHLGIGFYIGISLFIMLVVFMFYLVPKEPKFKIVVNDLPEEGGR